jgi:hypothetical protein
MKLSRIIVLTVLAAVPALAQQKTDQIQGAITSVNAQNKQITVTTDKNEIITVTASDRTSIVRMPAGVTDPKQGVKIELPTVTSGDKIIAFGKLSDDKKSLDGLRLYILTKNDIAAIHKQEDEEWVKRGTSGEVTAVDAVNKKFTIKAGSKDLTIELSDKTDLERYSPDSFKSTDAKPSSIGEIQLKDQVRVLGNKNDAGDTVAAERIFFGTFRRYSATIDSVDAAANELRVKDLETKKMLVIKVDPESQVKKLTPETADMLARIYNPAAAGDGGRGRGGAGNAGGRGRGGRGGANIAQVFDRAPAVNISALKKSDAIVVLTTAGSTPGRVTAVMVVAGVEPLLSWAGDVMSGWSLGGGGGEGN